MAAEEGSGGGRQQDDWLAWRTSPVEQPIGGQSDQLGLVDTASRASLSDIPDQADVQNALLPDDAAEPKFPIEPFLQRVSPLRLFAYSLFVC
jgi:hypothetical protein